MVKIFIKKKVSLIKILFNRLKKSIKSSIKTNKIIIKKQKVVLIKITKIHRKIIINH